MMEWEQFGIMLITFVGLFIWNRNEARSDTRMMLAMIDAIQKEIKDFHGRLCALEERKVK